MHIAGVSLWRTEKQAFFSFIHACVFLAGSQNRPKLFVVELLIRISALREWRESDLDVIMVGRWMLFANGWGLIWTLSCLAHGCSVRSDGV